MSCEGWNFRLEIIEPSEQIDFQHKRSIFDDNKDDEQLNEEAYDLRNDEIGYKEENNIESVVLIN